ncbi:glycosyltransferase, partial [Candidatus Shapirobacteria bacterium]|nr:glycosyltransferase [Candidatus Shapirobacteria bacterium]
MLQLPKAKTKIKKDKMKISFIATVLNEEKTIEALLSSLSRQTKRPDEIIIADGGSTDQTVNKIKAFQKKHSELKIKVLIKKGANRSQGRNLAIKKAKNEIIAISDAGCEPASRWLEKISQPFSDPNVEVVAGYFKGKSQNVFQECVATFALPVPHRLTPKNFLPASRSMAIRKKTWQKFGGFPEEFADNEDFVFSTRLKKGGAKIVFTPEAIVHWYPREDLKSFAKMIYRFARGDAFAGLRYPKVATIFGRYFLALILICLLPFYPFLTPLIAIIAIAYFFWPIFKNYRYVKKWPAFFLL